MTPTATGPRPLLDDLAKRATQKRALFAVLEISCVKHNAVAGQPCWTIPSDDTQRRSVALCGDRIAAAYRPSNTTRRRATIWGRR